jgi:hypothetical protein
MAICLIVAFDMYYHSEKIRENENKCLKGNDEIKRFNAKIISFFLFYKSNE